MPVRVDGQEFQGTSDLAKALDVSHETIRRWADEVGLPKRMGKRGRQDVRYYTKEDAEQLRQWKYGSDGETLHPDTR